MPQLEPAPWLTILLFSWFVFLAIAPTKIMTHTNPNEPTLKSAESPKTETWNWPWH